MTTKDVFTPDEWTTVLQGPTGAGMYVVTATRGGMFRETVAMSKAYAEARAQHGESELLDAIVAARPSRARRRRKRSTATAASSSPCPRGSRQRTARTTSR
jgi:hypothetical protein